MGQQDLLSDRADIGSGGWHLPDSPHVVVSGHLPRAHLRELKQVILISSVPLWGERGACVRTRSGRIVALADPVAEPVRGVLLEDRLTRWEQEACLLLPSLAASMAWHIPATVPVLQRVHAPDTAILLPLVDEAAYGNVPAGLLRELSEHAADRQQRLIRLVTRRWQASAGGCRPVEVELSAELEAVADRLARALARGRIPSPDSLVQAAERQGPLWRQLVRRLRPTRASDLSALSMMAAQLRAARSTAREPRLAVTIDSIAQYAIGQRTQEARTLLRGRCHSVDYSMIGLYVRSRPWLGAAHRAQPDAAHEPRWRAADEADHQDGLPAEARRLSPAEPSPRVSSQPPGALR
ncbi:hypothetical protein [Nonomuraea sp. NPDC049400]|uniref:hypothetical protein n=1 Tax=Nonomuraea sp. NPDC049400 TaxID=3364352 RepID=UPI0037895C81